MLKSWAAVVRASLCQPFVNISRRGLYPRGILAVPLSVISRCSIETTERIELAFDMEGFDEIRIALK